VTVTPSSAETDVDEQLSLGQISMPSSVIENVTLEDEGATVTLRFDLPQRRRSAETGVRLTGVRAYRHRVESHCRVWHIDAVVVADAWSFMSGGE